MTKKKLSIENRLALIITGLIGSMVLIVYSLEWVKNDIGFSFLGFDITEWTLAFITVVCGLLFATMLKSGLLGKWKLD